MSEAIPDIVARVRLDTSDLDRGVGRAAAIGGAIGGALGGAVSGLVSAAMGKITEFVSGAVPAFAQLEDATAAAGVVFGDSMGLITEQASTAADTLGLTQAQVIDAANTFGTFGKAAGLSGNDLAGFSTEMTALAADMASFKGKTPEQAINAIGSALRGEYEPMRDFGVLMDEASLKAQAMAMGIYAGTGALTPQQKVLAAQAMILAGTTDAQGDFARTMDSTANVAKRQEAAFTALQTAVGGALAPALTAAKASSIGFLTGLTGMVEQAQPSIQAFVTGAQGAFAQFGQVLGDLWAQAGPSIMGFLQGLGSAFTGMGPQVQSVVPALLSILQSLSPLGIIFRALMPVLPALGQAIGGVLAAAFTALAPVIGEVATILSTTLGTALQAVAPLIGLLAGVVISLLPTIMTLIPPIMSIVTALLPIVAIAGELIGAILPPLAAILTALLPPIASLVVSLVGALAPILVLVANIIRVVLVPILTTLIGWVANVITWVLRLAGPILTGLASALGGVIQWVSNAITWVRNFFGALGEVGAAIGRFGSSIASGVSSAMGWVRGIAGQASAAIGNLGSTLFNAGKNLIQGFIDGITGMIGRIRENMTRVVGIVRDFWPFSPAKTGPLSGSGSPDRAGRNVASMFASGIAAGIGDVATASSRLSGAVNVRGSAVFGTTAAATASGGPPTVRVFIGDQELRGIVRTEVGGWAADEALAYTYGGVA